MILPWDRLTRSESAVLAEIVTEPGLRAADLAAEVGLSTRRVRDLVSALSARGMIRTTRTLQGRAWVPTYTATSRGLHAMQARLRRAG